MPHSLTGYIHPTLSQPHWIPNATIQRNKLFIDATYDLSDSQSSRNRNYDKYQLVVNGEVALENQAGSNNNSFKYEVEPGKAYDVRIRGVLFESVQRETSPQEIKVPGLPLWSIQEEIYTSTRVGRRVTVQVSPPDIGADATAYNWYLDDLFYVRTTEPAISYTGSPGQRFTLSAQAISDDVGVGQHAAKNSYSIPEAPKFVANGNLRSSRIGRNVSIDVDEAQCEDGAIRYRFIINNEIVQEAASRVYQAQYEPDTDLSIKVIAVNALGESIPTTAITEQIPPIPTWKGSTTLRRVGRTLYIENNFGVNSIDPITEYTLYIDGSLHSRGTTLVRAVSVQPLQQLNNIYYKATSAVGVSLATPARSINIPDVPVFGANPLKLTRYGSTLNCALATASSVVSADPITQYEVFVNGVLQKKGASPALSKTYASAKTYSFYTKATSALGTSVTSNTQTISIPPPPKFSAAPSLARTGVSINATASSVVSADSITRYQFMVGSAIKYDGSKSAFTASYPIATTQSFKVRAFSAIGWGAWSSVRNEVVPNVPNPTTVEVKRVGLKNTYTANIPASGDPVLTYEFRVNNLVKQSSSNRVYTASYTAGTKQTVKVRTYSSVGWSAFSPAVNADIPNVPSTSTVSVTRVGLENTYTASVPTSVDSIQKYNFYVNNASAYNGSNRTYSKTYTEGSNHSVKVRSYSAVGWSAFSAVKAANIPSKPSKSAVSIVRDGLKLTATATIPSSVDPITKYNFYINGSLKQSSNSRIFTATYTPGASVSITVKSYSLVGWSDYSSIESIVMPNIQPASSVTASKSGNTVTFTSSIPASADPITIYQFVIDGVVAQSTANRNYIATYAAGSSHTAKVRTLTKIGWSNYSNLVSVEIPAPVIWTKKNSLVSKDAASNGTALEFTWELPDNVSIVTSQELWINGVKHATLAKDAKYYKYIARGSTLVDVYVKAISTSSVAQTRTVRDRVPSVRHWWWNDGRYGIYVYWEKAVYNFENWTSSGHHGLSYWAGIGSGRPPSYPGRPPTNELIGNYGYGRS